MMEYDIMIEDQAPRSYYVDVHAAKHPSNNALCQAEERVKKESHNMYLP